jgi:signal transduction histidine kinase
MNWNNYRAADSILNIVKPIVLELNNIKSLALYYFNMGDVEAYYKKNIQKAIEYYNKSYDYANQTGYPDLILKPLQSILAVKIDRNDADTKSTLDLFYKLSKENDFMYETAVALDYYADWYFKQGNYKMAYDYARQYQSLSDSIVAEDTKEQTSLMEIRFRVANKEQEINKLKDEHKIQQLAIQHKNTLNYILVGGIIALLCILILSFYIYKSRQKIQQQRITELEKEKQLQATEAVLKGQEDERSRIAKDLHDGLGGLLSGVKYSLSNMKENVLLSSENALSFERTIDMLDSGIKELRRVSHNMMPENLVKFGLDTALKDYCSAITKTKALQVSYSSFGMEEFQANTNISVTVYRVIQELINNTMKHAGATASIVQLSKDEHKLHITVEDNGKGFDVKNITAFKGAGWTNIQNRVTYLKGKIDVDSSEQNGTSVIIEIPLS